jgi:O-antigen/teichoic acid export membrane protein
MQIGRKDLVWNFAGTFMRVASGLIVLPPVLHSFSKDEYGLWIIFVTVGSIATLFDFGFNSTFGRNITYIFSGVKTLQSKGYIAVPENDKSIDYNLLKSTIVAIKKYYTIVAGLFLALFLTVGTFYFSLLLQKYRGNHSTTWIAWILFGILIAYQLYTYYYYALLAGRGQIKRSQQAIITGQSVRIVIIYVMVLLNFGLIALVVGQIVGDLVIRTMNYLFFYDKNTKAQLDSAVVSNIKEIMKMMIPNAARMGITTLGSFLVVNSITFIAPLFLSLADIGSYGLTKLMIDMITALGLLWFSTFYPKLTYHRVNNESVHLKRMYIKGKLSMLLAFLILGTGLAVLAPWLLSLFQSQTHLLSSAMLVAFLIVAYFDANQVLSIRMLVTKNEVPFAKAAIITGIATVLLLYLGLKFTHLGVWAMILAPGIAQMVYQNWKWSLVVIKDMKIIPKDYILVIKTIWKENIKK